jgi:hypothetical protein
LGLRWLLCYEEHDRALVHLQKAAPKDWFAAGQDIRVQHCPTRFGLVSWITRAVSGQARPTWRVNIQFEDSFRADLAVHIHPPGRQPLRTTTLGQLQASRVILPAATLAGKKHVELEISCA